LKPINVKKLLHTEIGTTEKFEMEEDISTIDLPEELEGHTLSVKGKLILLEDSVVVSGVGNASLTLICGRCLDNFDKKIEFSFEREYMLDRKQKSEDNLYVDKYLNIDLTPELRTEIILAVPIQNICEDKCKGICIGCGVNLNHETCKCNKKTKIGE
jgi:uncharacterized protein